MADMNLNIKQFLTNKLMQRASLVGRVKLAQAIQMPEREWAKILQDIERNPVFQELFYSGAGTSRIISYKRYGRAELSQQFYDVSELNIAGNTVVSPEVLLEGRQQVLKRIQKIGRTNFERYFLYREESLPVEALTERLQLNKDDVQQIQDFILQMSVNAEFFHPTKLMGEQLAKPTCVGHILKNEDGSYSISFFSPHLARGRYEVNREELKKWIKERKLEKDQVAQLRKFVGIIDLLNLKQGAFMSCMEYVLGAQKEYFDTQDPAKLSPVSLRQVARILHFSPSTVCRTIGLRSVLLPWGHEVRIAHLMPGKRKVLVSIVEKFIESGQNTTTDLALTKKIVEGYGIKVSRRTVTACRHALGHRKRKIIQ